MEQQLILDRYRPLEELGEGGFGSVVLAWDTRMQRRVAIKRLDLPLDEHGDPHRPVGLAEARTAAMLNHPSIVTVFDFDTDSDEAFLVMEHVDGASVAELLDDLGGPLDLDEAAAVVEALTEALAFAHENGVLHLDIKPENVLVSRDGRVKLADLGMAELSSLAGHGPAWGGTPGYMPLEQLAGERVSERSDEWAFAALVYEMLTGDNPFAAGSAEEAVAQIELYEPPLLTSYEPEIPTGVDDVVLAALGPHPRDRYPDVEAFAAALLPLLGDAHAGRVSLAELVRAYSVEDAAEETPAGLGLWDRLQGRAGGVAVRLVAAAESAWLTWAGLAPLSLERLASAGAVALVAIAAAFAPSLGVGLGLACFAVGLAAAGAWLSAALVALAGGAWWWFVARRSPGAAVLPLAGPVLAVTRVPFVAPLACGFSLPAGAAATTAAVAGAITMLASALSGQTVPFSIADPRALADVWAAGLSHANLTALLTDPSALVALAGWPAAAVAASLGARRATRGGAALGATVGSVVLGAAYALAGEVSALLGSPTPWFSPTFLVSLGGSLILMLLVSALGAPVRAEEEGRSAARAR